MEQIWNYAGIPVHFDVSDAEDTAKLTDAILAIRDDFGTIGTPSVGSLEELSGNIEKSCRIVRRFFGILFGEDTARTLCGEAMSFSAHFEAYTAFLLFLNDQLTELQKLRESVEDRFAERLLRLVSEESHAEGAV